MTGSPRSDFGCGRSRRGGNLFFLGGGCASQYMIYDVDVVIMI